MEHRSAQALVGACLYVAMADRDVDRRELDVVLGQLARRHPELSAAQARRIVGETFGDLACLGRRRFLRRLARRVDDDAAHAALCAALHTAAAGGELGDAGEDRLTEVALAFGIPTRELARLRREYADEYHRDFYTLRRLPMPELR